MIGAQVFLQIWRAGRETLWYNLPILQNSEFGWIITKTSVTHLSVESDTEQNRLGSKLWTLENLDKGKSLMPDEDRYSEEFSGYTLTFDNTSG